MRKIPLHPTMLITKPIGFSIAGALRALLRSCAAAAELPSGFDGGGWWWCLLQCGLGWVICWRLWDARCWHGAGKALRFELVDLAL